MIIYKITNLVTNKVYIGRSITKYRKNSHNRDLKLNKHHSIKLQRSYNKYGKDNFIFEIVEKDILKENINKKEIYYIALYNSYYNEYNCTKGGENDSKYWLGKLGGNHNTSKKTYQYDLNGNFIREWNSVIEIQRELNYNTTCISGCCNKRNQSAYGFIWYHTFLGNKIEKFRRTNTAKKKVIMIDLITNIELKVFSSAVEASIFFFGEKKQNKISEVCNGNRTL